MSKEHRIALVLPTLLELFLNSKIILLSLFQDFLGMEPVLLVLFIKQVRYIASNVFNLLKLILSLLKCALYSTVILKINTYSKLVALSPV